MMMTAVVLLLGAAAAIATGVGGVNRIEKLWSVTFTFFRFSLIVLLGVLLHGLLLIAHKERPEK